MPEQRLAPITFRRRPMNTTDTDGTATTGGAALDPQATAAHMRVLHRNSTYPARQRATDHALSYSSSHLLFGFWCAVVDALDMADAR